MEAQIAEQVPNADAGGPRFVTIEYFWRDMLGFKSKQWFYKHAGNPGMPQRVYYGGKPMLVYDECVAYQQRTFTDRKPPATPPPATLPRKRRPGRPVKLHPRLSS